MNGMDPDLVNGIDGGAHNQANSDYAAYEQRLNQFKHVKVLYIDDLFKAGTTGRAGQNPTAADLNLAFELLNYQYNNPQLITIISSQCTTDELMAIDDAIGGRIIERARGYMVNLTGAKNQRI